MENATPFETEVHAEMKKLITQKDYPCVAALQSFYHNDFRVKTYKGLGQHQQRPSLRQDLLDYLKSYNENRSEYFTFWAVFEDQDLMSEEEFEKRLWAELSSLTSEELREQDADSRFSSNPEDKNFCFSLGGKAFFVVGLHQQSSRRSRQFPWPTLIFNVFEQFDQLAQQGKYHPMIKLNRQRDIRYQGSANPMALEHNDDWESIQFSGRKNSKQWKCPFSYFSKLLSS